MKKRFVSTVLLAAVLLGSITTFAANERVTVDMVEEAIAASKDAEVERLVHLDNSKEIDQTVPAVVSWDESKNIPYENIQDMFGVHYPGGATALTTDDEGKLRPEYANKVKEMYRQPVVRWGGYNFYNMVDLIVPLKQRKRTVDLVDPTITNTKDLQYGPVEFIHMAQANNPDVKFLWCLSATAATPEDNANFIHFLLDDTSTKWGAMRASFGIEKPVPIWGIEIGNEMYFTESVDEETAKEGTDEYIKIFRANADAIHKVDSSIKIIPCLNGNSDRGGFYEWNTPIIAQLGKDNKYMAFHLYYSGYEYAYNGHWIDDTMALCEQLLGKNHGIRLCYTEHSKWDTQTCVSRMSLGSALATAQFLNIIMQRPETCMGIYHCGLGGKGMGSKWALTTKNGDDTMVFSSIPYMFKVYSENIGESVIPTTVQSDSVLTDPTSTARHFTAMATAKGGNQVALFLCNREAYTDFDLTFDTGNQYTLKKEIVFSAPNIASFEYTKNSQDVFKVTENAKDEALTAYHMPGKSIVCLILESDKALQTAPTGDNKFKGENKFTDIENHWAANQINLLAEAGVVNGVGDGIFDPTGQVTYAEFVAMLTRALKLNPVGADQQIFDNVPPDAWYFKPINTMSLLGFIRRTAKIEPEQPVTLKDAVNMIYQMAGNPPPGDKTKYKSFYSWFKDLSAYEQDGFAYEIKEGIISDLFEATPCSPGKQLNRGEAASVIYGAMKNISPKSYTAET